MESGDNQERADIDIAVSCPKALAADWNKVMSVIDDADTLLKIDCVRFDKLENTSDLKKNILSQGIMIYERHKD